MPRWPKDTQAERNAFYGNPAKGQIGPQMVPVVPPFAMFYEGKRVKAIQFHKLAAPALSAALNEIWEAYGRDQKRIDAAGVSKYNGAYNHRMVRGSKTKWSNHAYASAIDLNAAENGLYKAGNMPQIVIDAFTRQGAMWGGWYKGRKDPMHFEFVDNGGRKPKFPPPTSGIKPVGLMATPDAPADDIEADEIEVRPAVLATQGAKGDPEIFSIQQRLKAMNYTPGLIDGLWGSNTSGAVSGFINDRRLNIAAPTSLEAFNAILDELKTEIGRAESESPPFVRPVSFERASGNSKVVAEVAPEVVPVRRNFLVSLWGSIVAGFAAAWQVVGDAVKNMWAFFTNHKDDLPSDSGLLETAWGYVTSVPPLVWILLVGAGLVVITINSRKADNRITESVTTGARQ